MPPPLSSHPLRDADGTLIPLQSRVEQITVDRFDTDHRLIWVRPNLVRVIEKPNYCY
ncbi:MAG: hypothetical protein ACRDR6_26770 [Pseudonocardiaceae bacterium]